MSNFVRKRLRCELSPAKTPDNGFTNKLTGSALQAAKAAGCEFELCLFDLPDANGNRVLYDASNIASLTVQITKADGTLQASKTITRTPSALGSLNAGCTLAQWDAGAAQHALVVFSGADMNFAAGAYKVQVYGFTDDDTGDNDAFGVADLTTVDMFLNAGAASPSGKTLIYAEDLVGTLAGFLKKDSEDGVTLRLRSGAHTRTIGINGDGAPIDDIV